MRIRTRILFLIILLVCGCNKQGTEIAEDTLSVSAPGTKVHINGLKTCWDKGDAVTVFYKSETAELWLFKGDTGDTSGEIAHPATSRKETGKYIYVLYPHDGEATLESGLIRTEIPSKQQYRKNSYGTAVLVARSDFDFITMRYCTAVIELKYTGLASISHIILRGNGNEQICGESSITFDDSRPVLTCTGSTSARLDCDVAVQESETVSFYFSIAPGRYEEGLEFTLHLDNGEEQKILVSEEVSVDAGHIYTVEAGSYELPYKQKVISLLFSDGTTKNNPFTTDITFTAGHEVGPFYYELDGKNYPFYMYHKVKTETENFRITNGGGLYIGGNEGDYITFPAIDGYRLQNIGVSLNKTSDFHIVPADSPDQTVAGGVCSGTQSGDFRMLYLSGTQTGVSYRMMLDNNGCYRSINLYYRK